MATQSSDGFVEKKLSEIKQKEFEVIAQQDAVVIRFRTLRGFHVVWEAITQYCDNSNDVEPTDKEVADLAVAEEIRNGLDAIHASWAK